MEKESTIRNAIAQATERQVLLEIRYIDKHGNETVRLVRPDSVKGTVLFAYCMSRQAERVFVISRIQEIKLTDKLAPAVEKTELEDEEEIEEPLEERVFPTLEQLYRKWCEMHYKNGD